MSNNNFGGKGLTLWFTGLPSSGKTTLGTSLDKKLKSLNFSSVLLDGDVLRSGLNRDLGFSPESRHENNRRVSEVAKLFAQNGNIAIVTFISPYKQERQNARVLHENAGLDFIEIYLQTPLEICEKRDVKGLYKLARQNKIMDLTGIQAPYEKPENPDIVINTNEMSVDECINKIFNYLINNLNLTGKLNEDFKNAKTNIKELFVHYEEKISLMEESKNMVEIKLSTLDLEWLQILSEGWASPLNGFMREIEYLQCLHFSMIKDRLNNSWHILPLPIVLAIDEEIKSLIETQKQTSVKLTFNNKLIAVLKNIEIYNHRKEERVARKFTIISQNHPTIKEIFKGGNWLIGGDLKVFEKIKWEDGLDSFRLSPKEIQHYIKSRTHDAVVGFQLRNPIHNGHALLMKNTFRMLEEKGYKKPLLLLHPLGGTTKDDDVPLQIRIKQHISIFEESVLDPSTSLMAIFPSPMSYAGPTEVLWHCKARIVCGVNYYIVGRDPAGLPNPDKKSEDLYDPTHGAKILVNAPILEHQVNIVPFTVVAYNKNNKRMEIFDSNKKEEFEFISGTKMRNFARQNINPPHGFMSEKAWKIISDYYQSL